MISEKLTHYNLILASGSPRRQELLKEAGLRFSVAVMDYDESYPSELKGFEIAEYVAASKAQSFSSELSEKDILITADTIVWCNNSVLGKPENYNDAFNILREISGNSHEVITGVCIATRSRKHIFSDITKVVFNDLSDDEIDYYIKKCKPFDKAGAYGIQEWIGIVACSRIEGSYFNVVGLPVHRLLNELTNFISK